MATSGLPLGVNISLDPRQAGADCALAASLGAKWVRTSQEFTWDNERWMPRLQAFRTAASNHGLLLWQTCQGVPARFSLSGRAGHCVTTSQSGLDWWGNQCAAAAKIADATSLGNENNGYGSDDVLPNAPALADMCLAAVEHRNKLAAGRVLCTPELCPAGGGLHDKYVEPLLFFRAMIGHAPTLLDATKLWIGWHGYCDARWPAGTKADWNQAWRLRALDAYLDSIGHAGKLICSPEFGAATGPSSWSAHVTPAVQAQRFDDYWAEFTNQIAAGVKHGPMIWYSLRDYTPTSSNDWPAYCGLVDIHGRAKPVAARFRAAVAP
jgi:hypothetical protein